jgi:hypothetical protein
MWEQWGSHHDVFQQWIKQVCDMFIVDLPRKLKNQINNGKKKSTK